MTKFINWLKSGQVIGFVVSVAVLAAVSVAFFHPDAFNGASLQQSDIRQGIANGHEAAEFEQATGEKALWTNSLFGGMPTFQISPTYPSNSLFNWIDTAYGLGLPAPSNLLFMMMFGFLIMLFVMRFRWYYALLGALAWGFSTYFIIIIGAGHIWKFIALSYIPPTIAGLMLIYRSRYVGGAALTALAATMQLNANHPQMSYYFAFVMTAMVIAWLVEAAKAKRLRQWCAATAVAIGAGGLALGANLPSIYNTYEYAKETKRAQSELTPLHPAGPETTPSRPTGGMPYEQIVGWSYGKAESFSLLVPNIKGGASARPEEGHMTYMGLDRLPEAESYQGTPAAQLLPYLSQYFNDSEGTNGPVYVGALVFALFILGCIVVKGPVKWALLAVTALSLLLALGRNFAALTDFMIFNFPLYNKFRAVESILVIAEFTMPLLGVMGLHTLLTAEKPWTQHRKALLWAFGAPAAVCAAALLWPSLFGPAITAADREVAQNIQQQVAQMAASYGMDQTQTNAAIYQYSLANPENQAAIETLRYGMVSADATRSLIFLILGAAVTLLACRRKLTAPAAVIALAAIVLVDLFGVDKRYVSHSSFVQPTAATASPTEIETDDLDRAILADTDTHFRVLDINGFELPDRSFHHKMIGGYHAAKLIRYEDLIQRRLRPMLALGYYPELREDSALAQYPQHIRQAAANYRILDMLNTRYIITGDKDYPLEHNPHALGNAWLVGNLSYVDGADAEMEALGNINPATEAVADRRFAPILGEGAPSLAPGDSIWLTSYSPNTLEYHVNTTGGGLGVFSEVYFPWGWKASIDGTPTQLGRVNYLLRAMQIPAGSHQITMTFDPDSIHTCSAVAYACVTLIYLLCLAALFLLCRPGLCLHTAMKHTAA